MSSSGSSSTIGAYLRELNDGYNIASVAYDPWQMASLSQQLAQDNLPMLEFPQSSPNLTAMSQNLFELIEHTNIHLYASVELRNHAAHCVAVESTRGWRISKTKAANKTDGVVALAMACLQAVQTSNRAPLVIAAW